MGRSTPSASPRAPWAIVLAGGAGASLGPLTRRIHGAARPKQFAAITSDRSLLGETLERLRRRIPREHTVVIGDHAHRHYVAEAIEGPPAPRVIEQPADRGTATGTLLAVHWIANRDPDATVIVLPSDHFVRDPPLFMAYVSAVVSTVDVHPDWMVLIGATATAFAPGARRIEADADRVGPLWRVAGLSEMSSRVEAGAQRPRRWLTSTGILVARAATLAALVALELPELDHRVRPLASAVGTAWERPVLQQAYASLPVVSLTMGVLARCRTSLVVSRMPAELGWSDLRTVPSVLRLARDGVIEARWRRTRAATPARPAAMRARAGS